MTDNASTDPTLNDQREANASARTKRKFLIGGVIAVVAIAAAVGITAWAASGSSDSTAKDESLTVALQLFPDNLDLRTTAGAALEQTLLDNVYQPLVTSNPKGEIKPSLAKSWTISPDAKTYTFTLFADESFSNGDPLRAADVVWSLQQLTAKKYLNSQTLASVASTTAKDDTTVVITLKQPDPTLLYNLSGRAGVVYDRKATNNAKSTAVGSGPFLVKSFQAKSTLTLERNPKYWGDAPALETVVFKLFSDTNAIVNAVQAGTVDAANIDPNLLSQVEGNSDYVVHRGFASDKYTLAFNNRVKPLTDLRVRQAIRYAIDHQAIVKAVGGGKTLAGPVVASDPGYQDLSSLYPYDPTKAKQLLTAAGYGKGLTLKLQTPSFYGSTVTDLLTSQLSRVGIKLDVDSVDFTTWLKQTFTDHDYQLSIVDHAEARDLGNWANPDYYFGYDNLRVQQLFAKASTATTQQAYASGLQQAAKIVSQDAAGDWLYNPTLITAVRKGVEGYPTDSTSARLNLTRVSIK